MKEEASGTLQVQGVAALVRMEEALGLLDECNAPAEIAGHLDLAICRLRDAIGEAGMGSAHAPPTALRSELHAGDEPPERL